MTTDSKATAKNNEVSQKPELPSQECIDAIIRKRVYGAVAVGFVPVPLVDFAGFSLIQLEMVHSLCKAYGIPFDKKWVKSTISAICAGGVSVATVPFFASLFKAIPVIGYTAGAATISITGAASTYALGHVFNRHFKKGGQFGDFDVEEGKSYFKEKLEEGKTYVKKLRNSDKAEATPETA